MRLRALLNAARWLGVSTPAPCKPRRPAAHRRLFIEVVEERRVLSAGALINALYQDVLNRAPDPAGMALYANLLATGTTAATIVTDIWNSSEHREIEVDSYYQKFFNRPADVAGQQSWVNDMLGGLSEETLMADFLSSAEFQADNPTPSQFVTALYEHVLGRAPDTAGLSAWVTDLTNNTATSSQVVTEFVNSNERHVDLVNSYYNVFLQREPDPGGQAYWVQQLDAGAIVQGTVAQDFLNSTEFTNDFFLPDVKAGPGQIVVTIVGTGSVTDSTGQINTLNGENVATYTLGQNPELTASTSSVTWSLYPNVHGTASVVIPYSEFQNGLNITATF